VGDVGYIYESVVWYVTNNQTSIYLNKALILYRLSRYDVIALTHASALCLRLVTAGVK
jgi:hypothetical protein